MTRPAAPPPLKPGPTTDIAPGRPFASWEWALAFRYLRTKRKNGGVGLVAGVAFTAIALAIAAMITVMSVMGGFRAELLSRILGFNGHAYVQGQALSGQNYPFVVSQLEHVPGVVSVAPLVESQGLIMGKTNAGAVIRGIAPSDLKATPLVANNIKAGSIADFGKGDFGGDEILIGDRLAESLGVGVGDTVTLYGTSSTATPLGSNQPVHKDYTIGAIFEVGMAEYDQTFVFMPLEQAQVFFGRGDDVDNILVMVDDPDHVERLEPAMKKASVEGAVVSDWKDRNAAYWGALQIEQFMIRLIMLLVVGMAALNIISALVMMVKNKERDIAILRTIGASRGAIMRIFLISGTSIGVVATPVGVILGVLISTNLTGIQHFFEWISHRVLWSPEVYFLPSVPSKLDWLEVLIVSVWTFLISVAATVYPSWKASRTDPVEALRYE